MTACVNRKHTKKVAAVVTASLVGALSLGVAPVAAMATDEGIELQAATEKDAYYNGVVSTYTLGGVEKDYDGPITLKKSDLAKSEIEVTSVDPKVEGADPIEPSGDTFYYLKSSVDAGADCEINGSHYKYVSNDITALGAGDYVAVTVYQTGDTIGTSGAITTAPVVEFTVVADDLSGAKVMKDLGMGNYTDELSYDATQTWDDLKVVLDGEATSDVTFKAYNKNDDKTAIASTAVIEPGDYVIIIEGATGSSYEGAEAVRQEITVSKLDLSTLNLYLEDVDDGVAPTISDIKGSDIEKINGSTSISTQSWLLFDISGKTWETDGLGEYTYVLKVNTDDAKAASRFEGELEIKLNKVDAYAKNVSWFYGDKAITAGQTVILDRSADEDTYGTQWVVSNFDLSKVNGSYNDENGKKQTVSGDQLVVTVRDAEGNVVEDLAAAKKGSYTVTVEAVSSEFGYKVKRSTVEFKLNIKSGIVGTADTAFTFDGKVVSSINEMYDGGNFLDRIGITVKSGDKTLAEGTDYTVTVKKDGKVVDEIVDAGEYEIIVSSDYYQIGANYSTTETLTVEVSPVTLTAVEFDREQAPFKTFYTFDADGKVDSTITGIPYTGSAITEPVVTYDVVRDGETVTEVLPANAYTIVWTDRETGEEVDVPTAAGKYDAEIVLNDDVVNYQASGTLNEAVQVVKDMPTGFADVADEDWYAESINRALANEYVHGIAGTKTYAPNQDIKRGDVAVILFNMANGKYSSDKDFGYTETGGYETGFNDVDGNMYYAQAIAWAKSVGVVNGYEGSFRPEDKVTREEFAAMLGNYAELSKTDVTGAEADLSIFDDADQVSDWAKESVEWTVAEKIMGNGGYLAPQSNITRAEVAAMCVNFQSEAL